jgi:acyl carrier protein
MSNKMNQSNSLFNQIATELYNPEEVLEAIESHNRATRPLIDGSFVPPRNPVEQELAAIWADVLGLDQIGVHDNFFKLGGNSVLGIQVMSRLSEIFDVELSLRALFEVPTVASLAMSIIKARAEQLDGCEVEQLLTELGQLPETDLELMDADGTGSAIYK